MPLPDELRPIVEIGETAPDRFSGRTPDWPGGRVFGGIVVAQALVAATKSVSSDGGGPGDRPSELAPLVRPHSLHGYFLSPVLPGSEVAFEVEPLRDSRSFALRQVTTIQDGVTRARFLCSFHIDEKGEAEYQLNPPTPLEEPDRYERSPGLPHLDLRVADPVVGDDGTFVSSGRHWVRVASALPDDWALHAGVLAYLSDQTRLSFRPHSEEAFGTHTDASLDHAVWFHRPARTDRWLRYELQALSIHGNRSTVRGLMFDEEGALVMSMAQELLVRPVPGGEPQVPPWRRQPE
jgi:acyl-CoA thioesterase-2